MSDDDLNLVHDDLNLAWAQVGRASWLQAEAASRCQDVRKQVQEEEKEEEEENFGAFVECCCAACRRAFC